MGGRQDIMAAACQLPGSHFPEYVQLIVLLALLLAAAAAAATAPAAAADAVVTAGRCHPPRMCIILYQGPVDGHEEHNAACRQVVW